MSMIELVQPITPGDLDPGFDGQYTHAKVAYISWDVLRDRMQCTVIYGKYVDNEWVPAGIGKRRVTLEGQSYRDTVMRVRGQNDAPELGRGILKSIVDTLIDKAVYRGQSLTT